MVLLVKGEPLLGAFFVFGVARFPNGFFLELHGVFEIAGFGISGGQRVDVVPVVPGIDAAGSHGIGDGLFAVTEMRVRAGGKKPGANGERAGARVRQGLKADDVVEFGQSLIVVTELLIRFGTIDSRQKEAGADSERGIEIGDGGLVLVLLHVGLAASEVGEIHVRLHLDGGPEVTDGAVVIAFLSEVVCLIGCGDGRRRVSGRKENIVCRRELTKTDNRDEEKDQRGTLFHMQLGNVLKTERQEFFAGPAIP